MTERALSQTAIESTTAEQTGEVWLVLVTINHPDIDPPIRVVNNIEAITSRGNEYLACAFELDPPGDDPDGPTEARIKIDNVDRRIVDTIRTIEEPPVLTIEVVLASLADEPEISMANLTMRNVSWDLAYITGNLRFEDLQVEPVAELITPDRFPGLFTAFFALLVVSEAVRFF